MCAQSFPHLVRHFHQGVTAAFRRFHHLCPISKELGKMMPFYASYVLGTFRKNIGFCVFWVIFGMAIFRSGGAFFVFLCKTTLWNIFHKLPQQGCFQDDEMYSKMMFTTFFGHFVVILVMYSSILATNLHSKNVTFATKRPIFLRGPFLSFPSTPTR